MGCDYVHTLVFIYQNTQTVDEKRQYNHMIPALNQNQNNLVPSKKIDVKYKTKKHFNKKKELNNFFDIPKMYQQ